MKVNFGFTPFCPAAFQSRYGLKPMVNRGVGKFLRHGPFEHPLDPANSPVDFVAAIDFLNEVLLQGFKFQQPEFIDRNVSK